MFEDFEKKTGIGIVESNFASNEEMLAKIQAGAEGYDIIIPSDYMVTVMSNLKLLAPIDKSKIPNLANVETALMAQPHDPKNQWSVPYSWALVGIIYKTDKVSSPIESYRDFFTRDELLHRFSILDDSREMIASALKSGGQSANTTDEHVLRQVRSSILEIKKRAREFNSAPTSQLLQGDLLAAQIYSNEALRLTIKDPRFKFILPADGFTMSIDNMAIPQSSKQKDLAYRLINYLLDPSVNLKFATNVLTAPVVKGVYERLSVTLRSQPAIGPLQSIAPNAEMLHDLGNSTTQYDRIWTEIKASNI